MTNPFKIRSLQQRMVLFLLLPVAVLLLTVGFTGFIYARNALLKEWREAAVLKLQRAAHHVDMRLQRPIEWIEMLHTSVTAMHGPANRELILQQLRSLEGVAKVQFELTDKAPKQPAMRGRCGKHRFCNESQIRHRRICCEFDT